MTESDRLFDIFNDRYFNQRLTGSGASGFDTFTRFLCLPRELRVEIWTLGLRHRRFLRVLLEEITCDETPTAEGSSWYDDGGEDEGEWGALFAPTLEQRGARKAELVRITFLDASIASPALQLVCREAYEAYTSFYRIRLPSLVRVPSGPDFEMRRTVAHLHPDYDIISFEAQQITKLLPLFLHTLLQYDFSPAHLRFGIRNLCLDLKSLGYSSDNSRDSELATIHPPNILVSVRTAVSHLNSLYLRLTTPHLEPRVTTGPLTGSGAQPWYNASMPVLPPSSWKDFSSQIEPVEGGDPRLEVPEGIADLCQVWIGSQIRPSMEVWEELERAWGAERGEDACDLRVRALVALAPEECGSMERFLRGESMERFLQEEKEQWLSWMEMTSDIGRLHCGMFEGAQKRFLAGSSPSSPSLPLEILSPHDWYLRRRQQTAAGFWLVDPKVLGDAKTTETAGKQVANLSEHGKEAIELWVFQGHS